MIHPTDTPPDGDFVAYVERLTAGKVVPASTSFAARSGQPSTKAALERMTRIPFLTHVKWVVALWIATQLLARFVPGAGFLFIPVLALYAVWMIFIIRRKPSGAFFKELRELAKRAAEEARKAPSSQQKNRP